MKRAMSTEEKIDIFKRVKRLIKSESYTFICSALQYVIGEGHVNSVDITIIIRELSEFTKYKPSMVDWDHPWWPYDDKESRISCCNMIIRDLKEKLKLERDEQK